MQHRHTRQRDAIWQTFVELNRPLTAQEAHEAALAKHSRLGLATVYRCIKLMVEEGRLNPVELPGEATRYEAAADGEQSGEAEHHAHFLCRECGHAYCLEGDLPGSQRLVPEGFEPEAQDLVIYGRCSECRVHETGEAETGAE